MSNYYKRNTGTSKPKALVFFNITTMPKPEGEFSQELFNQKKYAFDKNLSYKYTQLATETEKDNFIKCLSFQLSNVVCISGKLQIGTQINEFTSINLTDEKDVLKNFFETIVNDVNKMGYDIGYVHFNGLSFAVPYLIRKCIQHQIEIKDPNFLNLIKFRTHPHYDLCSLMSNWGGSEYISLINLKQFLDMDIELNDYITDFTNVTEDQIKDNCKKTIEIIQTGYNRTKDYFITTY
jgi:hypothetical protein